MYSGKGFDSSGPTVVSNLSFCSVLCISNSCRAQAPLVVTQRLSKYMQLASKHNGSTLRLLLTSWDIVCMVPKNILGSFMYLDDISRDFIQLYLLYLSIGGNIGNIIEHPLSFSSIVSNWYTYLIRMRTDLKLSMMLIFSYDLGYWIDDFDHY